MHGKRRRVMRQADMPTVGFKLPTVSLIDKIGGHDPIKNDATHPRLNDRHEMLDPPIQISRHPIRRRDKDQRLIRRQHAAVSKADNAGMLQEPAYDGMHTDIFGKTR